MSFAPLLDAGWVIATHAIAALTALCLGTYQLLAPKGTISHRTIGYVWCGLMAWVAGSSLFIHKIRFLGPFSPIHILSVLTLVSLVLGLVAIHRKDVRRHRKTMIGTYVGGLVIAGLFTLIPGRIMHQVLFGS